VNVDSIDASVAKVQAAGGKIVTPNTPIPAMGAYRVFPTPKAT
jgi:predicted enzyme related to lactoylglutathione lyase